MAAVEERVLVEHSDDAAKGVPHVNLKSGIKSQHKHISVSPLKELKRLTSSKKKNKTNSQRRKKRNVSTKSRNRNQP